MRLIIPCMRRGPWLLLLLILLTTLRGLVGPAMAAGMALPAVAMQMTAPAMPDEAGHADHASHGAMHAEGLAATQPAHCHEAPAAQHAVEAQPVASGCPAVGNHTSHTAHTAHAACADCEICHTALLVPTAGAEAPLGQQADRVRAPAARFASAGAALVIKPPIS